MRMVYKEMISQVGEPTKGSKNGFTGGPSTKHMIFLEDDMVRSRGTLHGYDSSTTRAPFAYGQGVLVWLFQWQPPNPANHLVIRVEPLNDTYFPLQKADSRESALFFVRVLVMKEYYDGTFTFARLHDWYQRFGCRKKMPDASQGHATFQVPNSSLVRGPSQRDTEWKQATTSSDRCFQK